MLYLTPPTALSLNTPVFVSVATDEELLLELLELLEVLDDELLALLPGPPPELPLPQATSVIVMSAENISWDLDVFMRFSSDEAIVIRDDIAA